MIYLDAAATANRSNNDNVIIDKIANAMRESWQNPSSLYASNVKEKINECRFNIANFIGAKSDELIFTSGASESNNMAIRGWVDQWVSNNFEEYYGNIVIITTTIEHKSIIEATKNNALGAHVYYCDVDEFGIIDMQELNMYLQYHGHRPILVSVNMANNEIGTIQDIKRISDLVHRYNALLHIDATQALGHIPIDVNELGIDLMSASGHKISPVLKGIGFLYKRKGVDIQPLVYGAQENQMRGGTENTFGIIGLSKALELCDVSNQKIQELCDKRDYFIELLESKFGCKLNGHKEQRLPNNINVTFPQNITGESLLYTLEMSGVLISSGSACNSKSIEPSHVLKAINVSDTNAMKTVRFSLSNDITYKDIDNVVNEIDKAIRIIEV